MAEISLPAWPIPIHQTKLTMANPQPTGMLMPQIPTPLANSQATATVSTITNVKVIAQPATQPREVGRVRTMPLILSVTEAQVYPGSMTGATGCTSAESYGGLVLMPSPFRDWGYARRQGRWCEAESSV